MTNIALLSADSSGKRETIEKQVPHHYIEVIDVKKHI